MDNEIQTTNAKFEFGSSFQYKIITNILTDKSFANSMLELLNPQYFSTNSMAWIYDHIQSYMNTYKTIPTIDALKTLIQSDTHNVSDEQKQQIYNDIKSIFSYIGSDDLHFVQDQAIIFCKNEELAHAIYKSVDYLKNRDFDSIKIAIDNALKKGTSSDIGTIYDSYDAIEYRYTTKRSNLIRAPWPVINGITNGGFGPGELIVFVAPSGVGKSWLLQYVGARLIQRGKTVVHYTLELDESYTSLRYDKIICGSAQTSNSDPKFIASILKQKIYKDTHSVIKYYPTKTATVNTLRSHLDKMIMNGHKPDVIIVDYGDLIKPMMYNKDGERFNIDEIYKELRGLAGEYGCPVFTASQTNRGAVNKTVITNESIAESYGKVMIADFIMTLSADSGDITENVKAENIDKRSGNIHIAKNRFGPDGMTYKCELNFSTGTIEIYANGSKESERLKQKNAEIDIKNNGTIGHMFTETESQLQAQQSNEKSVHDDDYDDEPSDYVIDTKNTVNDNNKKNDANDTVNNSNDNNKKNDANDTVNNDNDNNMNNIQNKFNTQF